MQVSRPIKFRTWNVFSKKMDYEVFLDPSGKVAAFSPSHGWGFSDSEMKLMQYTGLNDRNGKEIYEDSIVLITGEQELDYGYTFRWNEKAIVRWDNVECGFYLDVINKREVKLCEDGCFTVDRFPLRKWNDEEWWIEYEVIGNEYEDPHLLEVIEQ